MAEGEINGKLSISNVRNADLSKVYASPSAKESVLNIVEDKVNPRVLSITGIDQSNFEVVQL